MALTNVLVANTNTTIYTSVGNNAITAMIVCNYGATTSNLTVYAVPNGGSAGNLTTIVYQLPIVAGETLSLDQEKLVLGNGDAIIAIASVTSMLTFTLSTLAV
jgi:hypothetical protein